MCNFVFNSVIVLSIISFPFILNFSPVANISQLTEKQSGLFFPFVSIAMVSLTSLLISYSF